VTQEQRWADACGLFGLQPSFADETAKNEELRNEFSGVDSLPALIKGCIMLAAHFLNPVDLQALLGISASKTIIGITVLADKIEEWPAVDRHFARRRFLGQLVVILAGTTQPPTTPQETIDQFFNKIPADPELRALVDRYEWQKHPVTDWTPRTEEEQRIEDAKPPVLRN
jgi:hypothetical protein